MPARSRWTAWSSRGSTRTRSCRCGAAWPCSSSRARSSTRSRWARTSPIRCASIGCCRPAPSPDASAKRSRWSILPAASASCRPSSRAGCAQGPHPLHRHARRGARLARPLPARVPERRLMQTTKIGLLVAIALAILMVTIFSLNQEQPFWERKAQYEVHFSRTGGLQTGAPVSLSGVTIGTVAEMRFPPDPAASYIQVLINVKGDLAPRIREDTVASIRTIGLLGDRYIELSAGAPESPPVPPGGLIASIDPIDIEALAGQGGDIVTNIVEVTASLKDVLGAIQRGEGLLGAMLRNRELGEATLVDLQRTMANVQATTASLEQILQRIDRGEGLLGQLTSDTKEARELLTHVRRSARSLDALTTRLNRGNGALARLMEDEAYAHRVLGNLDRAISDLADVAAKLDHGQGTLGKLVNDPSLYHDTKALVGGARKSWLLRFLGGGGSAPPPDAPAGDRGQ